MEENLFGIGISMEKMRIFAAEITKSQGGLC